MHPRERIEYRSSALRAAGLWREARDGWGEPVEGCIDTRSNDYLGFAGVVSRETTRATERVGAGASRLVAGSWREHTDLERELATWLGAQGALLFSSGYAANVGAISALVGPGETVLSDALNHASIIDGCRLSRATTIVLPHADSRALERALADTSGVRWVVTESYFGMDGSVPDLATVRALCNEHGAALIVDEAHALGVFGPQGRGLCAEYGVVPDLLIGGLGKAFGAQGGFAAGDQLYLDWLWNRARSFVFSTGVSPLLSAIARERLQQVGAADDRRRQLDLLARQLEQRLARSGIYLPARRRGPVFPIVFGAEQAVLQAAQLTAQHGVLCQPIRPPTVPAGTCRLRVTLRADMDAAAIDRIAVALTAAWRECGPTSGRAGDVVRGPGGAESASGTGAGSSSASGVSTGLARADTDAMKARRVPDAASGAAPARPGWEARSPRVVGAGPATAPGAATALAEYGLRPAPHRWIILGTGTGIGKTYVAQSLVRGIAAGGGAVAGLKPIETGIGASAHPTDAAALELASFHVKRPSPHPLYGFEDPVTPALAARRANVTISLDAVREWVATVSGSAAPLATLGTHTSARPRLVIETAGGVFSPLGDGLSNFHLAVALDPASWILVAPDRLGVLNDVMSCLLALDKLGRRPDWIVLSAPEVSDASTGTNADELRRLGVGPVIELGRDQPIALQAILDRSDSPG